MSTFIRIIIVLIEFLILFSYEFFHIKKELKKHNQQNHINIKALLLFYSIINITLILVFIFTFPKHIFLCYNKLILIGILVLTIISLFLLNDSYKTPNSQIPKWISSFLIVVVIVTSPPIICLCIDCQFDFIKVLKIEKKHSTPISYIENIIKLNDKKGDFVYIINFEGNKKPEVFYENDLESFKISDQTIIVEVTTITTKTSPELKNFKKYTEQENLYSIYVTNDMLIDLTK